MSRFAPYLSTALAVLAGTFVFVFANDVTVFLVPAGAPKTASSTLVVLPNMALPITLFPTVEPPIQDKATTSATSTQKIAVPEKIAKVPPKVAETVAPKTATTTVPSSAPVASVPIPTAIPAPTPPAPTTPLDSVVYAAREALVNIICYASTASGVHSISGSGMIIDPKGIILTNAHVAQYFLLNDRNVSCTIRMGSPAIDAYKAKLIYISPAWITANANVLTQTSPSGTGEYDFAFLAITKSATSVTLPSAFPFLPLATKPSLPTTPVVIASYGAQFLASRQIQYALFPTIVIGSVKEVFTFAVNTVDVLALGGSAAAQEGSSGGGVVDMSGSLVGTITTSTIEGAPDTRSLDAITASYIRAEYASETGQALDLLLAEPTSTAVANFVPKAPALESILTAQLP